MAIMMLPLVLVVPKYPAPVALATATEIASGKMASAASNIVKQVCCNRVADLLASLALVMSAVSDESVSQT